MSEDANDDVGTRDANWGACTHPNCKCTDYEPPATAGGHCQNASCQHSATWHEYKT